MRSWVVAIVVVFGCSVASAQVEKNLVQGRMVADAKAVEVGEGFRVAVVLKIKSGWHVYWKNPGDSGAATVVKFKGTAAVEISELRWPVPVKFEQAGGLVGYGYEGEVMLSAAVKTPAGKPVGDSITIEADVEWLCCEKVCVPGEAKFSVTVPVKEKGEAANAELFDAWEKRLPGDGGDLKVVSSGSLTEGRRGEFTIAVEAGEPLSKVEFFPQPEGALSVEAVTAAVEGKTGRVSFDARVLAGQKLTADALPGVVAVTFENGERRGVNVSVPLVGKT